MRGDRRLRVVLVLLVLTSLTFLTLDSRSGGGFGPLRGAASTVFGPFQKIGGSVGGGISDAVSGVVHGGRDKQALRDAQAKVAELQAQIDADKQAESDKKALDALGFLSGQSQLTLKPARVIGYGEPVGQFARTVTLDIGSSNGIQTDQAVVSGDGLVGRVVQVGSATSIVLLVDDPEFGVGVRIFDAAASQSGFIKGQGAGKPLLLTFGVSQASLTAGQRLQSVAATFPSGLFVGTVSVPNQNPGALEQTAQVTPAVNLDGLSVVGVVTSYQQGRAVGTIPSTTVSPSASASAAPTTSR